jgi:hypothetical protein
MRHLSILSALFLGGLCVTRAAAAPALPFYVQPALVYALPGGNINNAFGESLTLGASLNEKNALEIQAIYFKCGTDLPGLEIKFKPVLLKYKLSFDFGGKWTASVAPTAGAVFEQATQTVYTQFIAVSSGSFGFSSATYTYRNRQSDTAGAVGAEGGLYYRFNERVSLGGSVTALELSKTDITTRGGLVFVELKAGFRF